MNRGLSDLVVGAEVAEALKAGRAVVALESTLISHGLPRPRNLSTAREAEAAVRAEGAVPATIGVLRGRPVVGLDEAGLERLAGSEGIVKAGRRDLGMVLAGGRDAGTTVSATLHLARRAGIGVFATGGLGGVHRGAGATFDVSSDLDELARADGVLVVCSGAKSILDLPATLEALETRGVPVVGYGTSELPAFTTGSSGLPLEWRADTPEEAAAMVRSQRGLGLPGALVLAQPVPEGLGLDREASERAVAEALAEAEVRGVSGKATTPFLLDAVLRGTGGRSLEANAALIVANARLAARVAVALAGAEGSWQG